MCLHAIGSVRVNTQVLASRIRIRIVILRVNAAVGLLPLANNACDQAAQEN